jgi:hypothetical protein
MVAHGVDYAVILRKVYKPGDEVEASGVYRVIHESAKEHEVTVVHGSHFPTCHHCGAHPRFVAVKLAQHIDSNEHFSLVRPTAHHHP